MELGLTGGEKKLLRAAGLTPSDLAAMSAEGLMGATEEGIDRARAEHLTGRAELLGLGVHAGALAQVGIRNRADLLGQNADELFVRLVNTTSRTHPSGHDLLSHAVYIANTQSPRPELRSFKAWTARRLAGGADPLMLVWRHRHGAHAALPAPTKRRLLLPTIGVNAPIATGGLDDHGRLVTPVDKRSVVIDEDGPLRLVLGHWMWHGGHGPFVRLEDLQPNDAVRLGDEWYAVSKVDMLPAPPPGPLSLDVSTDGEWIVLATTPHYRAGTIGMPEDLSPVERGRLQVVVRADRCDPGDSDDEPRPIRRITGAY